MEATAEPSVDAPRLKAVIGGLLLVMLLASLDQTIVSRKVVLQAALVLFLVGSVLCGLAQDLTQLIAFRAIQGLGGGGLMVSAQAATGDVVAPRDRAPHRALRRRLRALVGRRAAHRRLLHDAPGRAAAPGRRLGAGRLPRAGGRDAAPGRAADDRRLTARPPAAVRPACA